MDKLKELFNGNSTWAGGIKEGNPDFFSDLAKGQSPEYLWIGCSDSRVPANQLADLMPGEMFVHRNIANVVVHSDLNSLSVIQYAVEVLKVKHVIVCGHYGCGGVKAALGEQDNGLIDNWLRHIKDVEHAHAEKLGGLSDQEKHDLLCELNVKAQVKNVCATTFVQDRWKEHSNLTVHGLIYDLKDGLLKDLDISVSSLREFEEI
ncbi:MAG TPA: carbonate dehydratase [Balneolaceae bacterium]|nr:carbonate dehydratase [Balneolaceae bacterium]